MRWAPRSLADRYGSPEAPLDPERARLQQRAYAAALRDAGYEVEILPADETLPDCAYVEDTIIVVGGRALVTAIGAPHRAREPRAVAARLRSLGFPLERLGNGARLDGGDVLRVGHTVFVGLSKRTNADGAARLEQFLGGAVRSVVRVPVERCLHLKTGVTRVAPDTVLLTPGWIDETAFQAFRVLHTDAREPGGANVLELAGRCLAPRSAPRTAERLASVGIVVETVDISEHEKADAGMTCLSVLLDGR